MATVTYKVYFLLFFACQVSFSFLTVDENPQPLTLIKRQLNNIENILKQVKEYLVQGIQGDSYIGKLRNDTCCPCVAMKDSDICDCRHLPPKKDCLHFLESGIKVTGLYKISDATSEFVYCDQATDDGGWTVIQRRNNGHLSFYRNWSDYKQGFGDPRSEFWIGNDNIHSLTNNNELGTIVRIQVKSNKTAAPYWLKYWNLKVGDEKSKYKLSISSYYEGNGTDRFYDHDNMTFSTYDQDNDMSMSRNCADYYKGAWWYNECSILNGVNSFDKYLSEVHWYGEPDIQPAFSEMKVRRVTWEWKK